MSDTDLPSLVKKKDHLGVLRYIRTHKLREPDLVIEHGKALLGPELTKNKPTSNPVLSIILPISSALDESEWLAALEQLCLASIDVHDDELASTCLSRIKTAVSPDSARVRWLLGRCLESSGDLAGADEVYEGLLKDNPANGMALKRKYAILRSQPGKELETREALNKYLELNSGDAAGWAELGDLCHDMGDYRAATYAYEEVVLASPLNSAAHCKLGELYATVGGRSNLKLARKHLAQSLELDPRNMRALFALVAAAGAYLDECSKAGKSKREAEEDDVEVAKELVKFGAEKLIKAYQGKGRMAKLIEIVMKDQTGSL
uniref:ER membrane protein complex subunit 2 n=1 Tax=Odontella aurita TaxID=265563 RepID=A0A7S4NBK7_9STRA